MEDVTYELDLGSFNYHRVPKWLQASEMLIEMIQAWQRQLMGVRLGRRVSSDFRGACMPLWCVGLNFESTGEPAEVLGKELMGSNRYLMEIDVAAL